MKKILVLAEYNTQGVRAASRSALTFARQLARDGGDPEAQITWLLMGHTLKTAATDSARYAPVLCAAFDSADDLTAERCGALIASVVREQDFDVVVAATTSFARDVVTRAGGLLGGAMVSEVVGHQFVEGELLLQRPMYAGSVSAVVKLLGGPKVFTVRASAYDVAEPDASPHSIEFAPCDVSTFASKVKVISRSTRTSERPDVTEARIVVSGGRAWKTTEDFENHVGRLADILDGAAGSSRVLVDAGITPNELQVGQTGKIVAPDLYLALGISGAIQHLAGMKNSKVVAAINNDPDAPIFQVSDYGIVGDVYDLVPKLISALEGER